MAEGGLPRQVINVPVNVNINAATEETTAGDQYYRDDVNNITNIRDANIGVVSSVVPQDQANPEQQVENVGPQERVQELNINSQTKELASLLKVLSNALNRFREKKSSEASSTTTGQLGQSTDSSSSERIQIAILRERCAAYMWRKKIDYNKVYKILKKIIALQQESDFDTKLHLVECYLYRDREEEVLQTINSIVNQIKTETIETDKLYTLAKDLLKSFAYIRGLILFIIVYVLYDDDNLSPDDLVEKFFDIVRQMHVAVQGLIKVGGRSKSIAVHLGIPFMEYVFVYLSSVKKCDERRKVLKLAQILELIGSSYDNIGEPEKEVEQRRMAITLLETQFGEDASKYYIYSRLLSNAGLSHLELGEIWDAKHYLFQYIECCKKARDFKTRKDIRKSIEQAEKELNKSFGKDEQKVIRKWFEKLSLLINSENHAESSGDEMLY